MSARSRAVRSRFPLLPLTLIALAAGLMCSPGSRAATEFTSFEDDPDGDFTIGTPPLTATFTGGEAQTVGNFALYRTGLHSWHVSAGTTAVISFATPASAIELFFRDAPGGGPSEVRVINTDNQVILNAHGGQAFQQVGVNNLPPGTPLIDRIEVENSGDGADVVVDDVTYTADLPAIPPVSLLLRRETDSKWFQYQLSITDTVVSIPDKGFLNLTRDFAFQTVSREDFDGDGEPDLLVRDLEGSANGRWVLYTLAGTTVTSRGQVDGLTRNSNWMLLAVGDTDGDQKVDLLLRNSVDGRWLLYRMDTRTVLDQGIVGLSTDLTDTFIGSGDFNGDGKLDVLLRRANGSWLLYTLNGLNAPVQGTPLMTTNLAFTVQALADFNGNGRIDVLLRRNDGRWFLYLLNGSGIDASGPPAMSENTDFSLVRVADFNNDGNADALLRRTDGRWFLYALDGLTVVAEGPLDMTRNTDFQVVTTDDYSDDGNADVLMRRADGRWVLYVIDGDVPVVLSQGVPDMTKNEAFIPQLD